VTAPFIDSARVLRPDDQVGAVTPFPNSGSTTGQRATLIEGTGDTIAGITWPDAGCEHPGGNSFGEGVEAFGEDVVRP
jgi:hypothetical protein